MLETIRLEGPRRIIAEDLSHPTLLGTGEHGAAMVAERAGEGQRANSCPARPFSGSSRPLAPDLRRPGSLRGLRTGRFARQLRSVLHGTACPHSCCPARRASVAYTASCHGMYRR